MNAQTVTQPDVLSPVEQRDQLGYARSIFSSIREPLLLLDGEGNVQMANEAFLRTLAVTLADTTGRPLAALGNGQWNIPALTGSLLTLQETGEMFEDLELRAHFDGLGERVMLLTGRLLDTPHTTERMMLLAIVDITERRRADQALAWHMTELERSNRDLEGFAFVASHDLQEPLRKIRAYGDLLLTECATLDEQGRDYATRMVNASARMQVLVADVLRLAVAGTGSLSFTRINLGDVVREILIDLDLTIRENSAQVEIGAMPTIECDRSQMRQLFQNLISNALKFRSEAAPRIRIDTVAADTPDHAGAADGSPWVNVRVIDNGIGFETRHANKIFAAFQRLHGRGRYPGSGIGLTLCRRICERHFGFITTASVPGTGTEFHIMLPSRQPARH